MASELGYSSVLTGAPFMLYEFKQIVGLKQQGLTNQEIKTKVLAENLFQYNKMSSIKRGLPYLLRRVDTLDDVLRNLVLTAPHDTVKVINLYGIMKTDRLFYEFMDEVIKEKLAVNDFNYEKKDINTFFTAKAEQYENIAQWTENTIRKLKQVYNKILLETGFIQSKSSRILNRLLIDDRVRDHLIHMGDEKYVQAMGE